MSITQLKNPQPARFKGAYKVYSIAPSLKLDSLAGKKVGNPSWSEAERQLYLKPHADPRYQMLAGTIAEGAAADPVARANAVVAFLSKNAIYTLSPGHEVGENEDPVAPFLFGDMRGYCVHFAHATVYLLRALGIPSRIGTGYLTDLSQSKDGHILLRMSDRHAWAEVYVDGEGWLPFDTKPEQVESHAETAVDMKLLEELMGMIGPDEEILPKDITKGEAGVEEEAPFTLPDRRVVLFPLLFSLLALMLLKLYALYGYMLSRDGGGLLRRSYVGVSARLRDLGMSRGEGETREEFRRRVQGKFGGDVLELTMPLNKLSYGAPGKSGLSPEELRAARLRSVEPLRRLAWWKRVAAALNPASAFAVLFRRPW